MRYIRRSTLLTYQLVGAPDPPVRRKNQNRLIGPSIVPPTQFSTAWKTQWHNASLIKFANFQIAIFRRELDRQPPQSPTRHPCEPKERVRLTPPPANGSYRSVGTRAAALIPQEAVARLPTSSLTTSSCLSIHLPRTFQMCVGSTLSPHCSNG